MPTLIAEDVLLLMLDDAGAFLSNDARKPALGGAVLAELAVTNAVEIETAAGRWKKSRVVIEEPGSTADPILVHALEEIAAKKRSPQDLVNHLGKNLPDQLCARLVERGVLRHEESKVLGLFSRTRWPLADPARKAELLASMHRVLVQNEEPPDERVAALIAVLAAADILPKIINRGSMSKKELKKRAEAISEGSWATEAVRKAIQATQAATVAAITAATTGAAVAGS